CNAILMDNTYGIKVKSAGRERGWIGVINNIHMRIILMVLRFKRAYYIHNTYVCNMGYIETWCACEIFQIKRSSVATYIFSGQIMNGASIHKFSCTCDL